MSRQRSGDAGQLLATLPASVRQRNPQLPATTAPARRAPRKAPQRAVAPVAALPPGAVVVTIDGLRLVNPLNNRKHWRTVSKRGRDEKAAVALALRGRTPPALPVVVTIARVGRGTMDGDGLQASAKHVRDSVAAWLGCDDGDPRVTWLYEQTRGPVGVRLTAEPRVAQVVTVAITGSQWADAMRTMLDRAGGWARFDVAGLSLRLVLTRADL